MILLFNYDHFLKSCSPKLSAVGPSQLGILSLECYHKNSRDFAYKMLAVHPLGQSEITQDYGFGLQSR